MHLKGAFTAMITPFLNGQLDEEGLIKNIQRQIKAGIAGLVFLGTTGEAVTLTEAEQNRVLEIGVQIAKGKALVIAGTGSNSTEQTIEKTKKAQALGADLVIVVTPYYNKPSQEGIYRHFQAITTKVDMPILVYNVPGRSAVNIETFTLLRIAALPNVIGVKEASGNIAQAADVLQLIGNQYPAFAVLSGDDGLTLPMMALGATGIISVASNLVPEQLVALVEAALEGRFSEAKKIHTALLPLFRLLFIEVNPVPIKEAMNFCQLPAGDCRLPLCEMKREHSKRLQKMLIDMRLRGDS